MSKIKETIILINIKLKKHNYTLIKWNSKNKFKTKNKSNLKKNKIMILNSKIIINQVNIKNTNIKKKSKIHLI